MCDIQLISIGFFFLPLILLCFIRRGETLYFKEIDRCYQLCSEKCEEHGEDFGEFIYSLHQKALECNDPLNLCKETKDRKVIQQCKDYLAMNACKLNQNTVLKMIHGLNSKIPKEELVLL